MIPLLIALTTSAAAAPSDCWPNAAGGTAKTIRREATFATGGLQGTIKTWATAGGYRIETAAPAAGYRSVQVFDGTRGWKADGASRAHELAELDLASLVTDAFFESLQAPKAAVAADAPHTFTVTPPGGTAVTVTLDPESCLPRTYTRKTAAGLTITTIEEWTTVDGIRLPAVIKQSMGDPKFDVTVRYTATKLNEPVAAAIFSKPVAQSAVKIPDGAPHIELPFELTQHHIYVPVQLGETKSWFVLDTGAEATVIDAEYAKSIGLTGSGSVAARGNGEATVTAQAIAKPSLTFAGLRMPIETMYAVPLRALWPREGRAMQGVLGHDALSHFVVEVDYAASRVRLHDPEQFTVPAGVTPLPMTYEGNIPAVRTAFELPGGRKIEGRMIVDTGNSGGIDLYVPYVEANGVRASLARTVEGAGGMGVGGVAKQDLARIAAFHLGPFKLNAPIVTLSRDARGGGAHPELAGNIGSRLLKRFTVFIDYPHDRLILKPNASLNAPFDVDMSGLALVAEGDAFDRIVVRRVLPETAAAAAGFAEGDEITAVNGERVSVHRLRELFGKAETTYEVKVKRGGEIRTITLATRRFI